MSFFRTFIAAVAAMGLASAVFAADEATTTNQPATPATTATTTTTTTTDTTTTTQEKVNINKATVKELMAVKGMNASKAKAIVAYRKKNGDFKSMDDLKQVKGFKKMDEKTMQAIEDQLTIG